MENKKIPLPRITIKEVLPKNLDEHKCAPGLNFDSGSCIPLNLLIEMAESYNDYHKNDKANDQIPLDNTMDTTDPEKYKLYLLAEFIKRYNDSQKEWIKQKFVSLMSDESKNFLKHNLFRPDGPQGKFDWLSTIDINSALSQYENTHKDFKFLGAVPIDFNDLEYLPSKELSFKKMTFKEFPENGITKIGVIFNTDPSTKSGQHWISLYADLDKAQVYFSDSYAERPPKEVANFIERINQYLKSIGKKNIDIRYNKTRHQKGGSECGVYSINFILRLLKGKTFDHITRKRLPDEQVNKCRIKYFANEPK